MSADVKSGDLLVASSMLVDPNFADTVVLLCEHSPQGSYGLVLNRPIEIPDGVREELPFVQDHLFLGGPVQTQAFQILHPFGPRLDGAVEVVPDVWVGADLDSMKSAFGSGLLDPDQCRFFLGYSGWGEGQLDAELSIDSWITVRATDQLVFGTSAEALWRSAVQARGRDEPLFAHYPKDPRMN